MFKYAAADFTGIDFGGSAGGSTQETIIQKVDLSQVEAELQGHQRPAGEEQRRHLSAAEHGLKRPAQPVPADGGPEPADQGHEA